MSSNLAESLRPLTNRQQFILDFMWGYFLENDMLPSTPEVRRLFGWKSNNSYNELRHVLEEKGYIERNAVNKFRFTKAFHAEQKRAVLEEA